MFAYKVNGIVGRNVSDFVSFLAHPPATLLCKMILFEWKKKFRYGFVIFVIFFLLLLFTCHFVTQF